MCLTIPGKIIEIKGDLATLDYGSEKREAKIIEGDYHVGDHVLIKARIVVEKVSPEQMKGWLEVLNEINDRQQD